MHINKMFKKCAIFLILSIVSIILVLYERGKYRHGVLNYNFPNQDNGTNSNYQNGNYGNDIDENVIEDNKIDGEISCSIPGKTCEMNLGIIRNGDFYDYNDDINKNETRFNKIKNRFTNMFQYFLYEINHSNIIYNNKEVDGISLFIEFFENSKMFISVFSKSGYRILYAYGITLISLLKILFLWFIILEPYFKWAYFKLKTYYLSLDTTTKKYIISLVFSFIVFLYLIYAGVIKYTLNKITKIYKYLLKKLFKLNSFLFRIFPYIISILLYLILIKTIQIKFIHFFIYSIFFPLPSLYSIIIIGKYVYLPNINKCFIDSISEKYIIENGENSNKSNMLKDDKSTENILMKSEKNNPGLHYRKGKNKIGNEICDSHQLDDNKAMITDKTENELKYIGEDDKQKDEKKKNDKTFFPFSFENFKLGLKKKKKDSLQTENKESIQDRLVNQSENQKHPNSSQDIDDKDKMYYDVLILLEYWLFINILNFLSYFFFFKRFNKGSYIFEYFVLFTICVNVSEKIHEFVFLKSYKSSILVRALKNTIISILDVILYSLFNVRLNSENDQNKKNSNDMGYIERSNILMKIVNIVKDKLKLNESVSLGITFVKSIIKENVAENIKLPIYIKILVNIIIYMPQLILLIFPSFILKIYFLYFFLIFPIFGSLKCLEDKKNIHNKIYFICYFFFYNIASITVNHAVFKSLPFYNLYKILITISVQSILKYIFNILKMKN
ncbi:conserved Plasmodium protein, unknown function [Plasmodium yoelii]|nr:conserved Plasmodium protein, unknown function [Plasmodium yoelii]CDU20692.1 conserved Plasmodium protein, unknown function [Plasmodium yoelii]VTZ81655.1 conserved Plasmodium protein, unknown function [Plasmodium yoelii]|eukprot:XP_729611.2 conserved Plasmodium protein, unknown function [Plasmodium yoelii]